MNSYKYETHLHTIEGSACASSCAVDYIEAYRALGYTGFFVTNHFFGGNTCVSADLPWKERIELFCKGYDLAHEACKNIPDFDVFFGLEQAFDGDEYLIFGLEKEWLMQHEEFEFMKQDEVFKTVNKLGGLIIQAHPYRLRDYIKAIHLHPRDVHGIEVYNACNHTEENDLAFMYAKTYSFPMTSGSDIHNVNMIKDCPQIMGGVEFDSPLKDVFDFAERIKSKKYNIIKN